MKIDITEKLRVALNKESFTEADVVYILTRVRKIWEFEGKPDKYKGLIFYCDWSVHTEIDKTARVETELKQFTENPESNAIVDFAHFGSEFGKFLEEFGLPTHVTTDESCFSSFKDVLIDIYCDTPLIVKGGVNKVITFSKQMQEDDSYGMGYNIKDFEKI